MSFRRFSRRLTDRMDGSGAPIVVLRSVDSTNSLAKWVARAFAPEGSGAVRAAFVAWEQTHGRGRGEHRWESPAGAGVYVSLLLPEIAAARLASLPLLVSVGLARGVQPWLGRPVTLRWPNDLLVAGRKLGGVLIESSSAPGRDATVVVGFGVNYASSALKVPGATSILAEATGQGPEPGPEGLAEVCADLVAAVETELERLGDEGYAARAYAASSVHRPGDRLRCRTPAGILEGRFRGFDSRGFMCLETTDGVRSMAAGELISTGDWR